MNEFTLEELETIREDLEHNMSMFRGANNDFNRNLLEKVTRMIDKHENKCDHKQIVTGAYPRSNPPKKCEICGVLYR